MGSRVLKKENENLNHKRMALKERFANPNEVLRMMSDFLKEGDVASITDLISSYVLYSPKYASQEQFAAAIGTTRQTLHRMLSHNDAVSMKVFFSAIEKIHSDAHGDATE